MNTNISIVDLTSSLMRAWSHLVPIEEAQQIADAVVRTALQKDSRMQPIRENVEDLKKAMQKKAGLVQLGAAQATRSFDLCGMPGIMFMPRLTTTVIGLAKESGVSLVSLKNSGGVHTLSTWLLNFPNHDCIGVFIWNGGSYTTVPYGSMQPFFGTNPCAYIIPTSREPLLLDMSTSEVPFMNLMQAIKAGASISDGAGLDERGVRTRDPKRIYDIETDSDVKLLPMGGGYKGSAIMLFIEILTGALIGSKMGREATSATFIPEEFGGILAAIDVNSFTSPGVFRECVTKMAEGIRLSTRASGFEKIRLPGDASHERERTQREIGEITLDDVLIGELHTLGKTGEPQAS